MIADSLRLLIKERGATITSLAKELGLSRQAVSMYVEGKNLPNAEKVCAIADYFRVSTDWLLGRADVRTQQEYIKYKDAIRRMGKFGRLFVEYAGCPRGSVGRYCGPLEKEIMSMGVITDVDGGEWIPVNKDALVEMVGRYRLLAAMAGGDPFAKAYEREDDE